MEISARPAWGGARANSGGPRPGFGGRQPGAGRPRNPAPRIIQTRPYGKRWHCVHLAPHHEDRIVRELLEGETRRGFPSRPPFPIEYPFTVVHNRSHRRFGTQIPMFAGYCFAEFDREKDPWPSLKTCEGAAILATRSGTPLPLPVDFVSKIQADAPDRLCLPSRAMPAFAVGARVHIDSGPMAGHFGICLECDGVVTELEVTFFRSHIVVVTLPRVSLSLAA